MTKRIKRPKQGRIIKKYDIMSKTGRFIGQLWYEHSTLFRVSMNDVRQAAAQRFPMAGASYDVLEVKSTQKQPLEQVRVFTV